MSQTKEHPAKPVDPAQASEALRKEWADLEWKLRTQLAFAYGAGKVVRAILEEQRAANPPAHLFKNGVKPEPYELYLADPRNRGPRNEFLAVGLEHGLVQQFGYHEIQFKLPPRLINEVVQAKHVL
ncbi:MAG: hypothetical protein O9327_04940 [Polaromonas sp.]|nr:hypothetical protein [Polaromonas sp.]